MALEGRYIVPERLFFTADVQRTVLRDADPAYHRVWVADQAGDVVGECEAVRGVWPKTAHTATIALIVAPGCRGQGIGQGFLETVEQWARQSGVEKLCLSVFQTNTGAIRLYQRMGYGVEAERQDQFRINGDPVAEWLMAKFLSQSATR